MSSEKIFHDVTVPIDVEAARVISKFDESKQDLISVYPHILVIKDLKRKAVPKFLVD